MKSMAPAQRYVNRKAQAEMLGGVSVRTVMRYAERFDDFPREIELTPTNKVRDHDELVAWVDRRRRAVGVRRAA